MSTVHILPGGASVAGVAISVADGGCRWAVAAHRDPYVWLYDLQAGTLVRTLSSGGPGSITSVALSSADGGWRWLVCGSSCGGVWLWDLESCTRVHAFSGQLSPGYNSPHVEPVRWVAILPAEGGARWAIRMTDLGPGLLDLQSGQQKGMEGARWPLRPSMAPPAAGRWQAFFNVRASNYNCNSLTTTTKLSVWEWDLKGATQVCEIKNQAQMSPRQQVPISVVGGVCRWAVSACEQRQLYLWDLSSGECARSVDADTGGDVTALALSEADGGCRWVLCGAANGQLGLWDLQAGERAATLEGHSSAVTAVQFSNADGGCRWALSGAQYGTLRLWSLAMLAHDARPIVGLPARPCAGVVEAMDALRRASARAREALAAALNAIRDTDGKSQPDAAQIERRDALRAELCAALEAQSGSARAALADARAQAEALRVEARALCAALELSETAAEPPASGATLASSLSLCIGRAIRAHDRAPAADPAGRGAVTAAWHAVHAAVALAAAAAHASSERAALASAWARALPVLHAAVAAPAAETSLTDVALAHASACDELAATADAARGLAREVAHEAEAELRTVRALPTTEIAHGLELRESEDAARRARRTLRDALRALEDAHDDCGDVDAAQRALVDARRGAQRAQRAHEAAVARLFEWAAGPFPELPGILPEIFGGGGEALPPGARPGLLLGRSLEQYERIPWPDGAEPPRGRHEVLPCTYAAERVVLKAYPLASDSERRALEREAAIVRAHPHPHVARVHGVFSCSPTGAAEWRAYVQLPLYSGGTLRGWLEREAPAPPEAVRGAAPCALLDPSHARVATTRVCALRHLIAALAHLHAHGVVHADVKLENAFVQLPGDDAAHSALGEGETFRVLLGDFDLARTEGGPEDAAGVTTRAFAGTDGHMAPELLVPGARASAASDVFAFGVCVLRALAADEPTHAAVLRTAEGARAAAAALGEPLICAALHESAQRRPSAAELQAAAIFGASDDALRAEAAARAARDAEAARLARSCAVCLDERLPAERGIECAAAHFVCEECLSAHVLACARADVHGRGGARLDAAGGVPCVEHGCAHSYLPGALARHCARASFDEYWSARESIAETRIAARVEADVEVRVRAEAERLARLPPAERERARHRTHIVENILTLKCPRCGMAFAEWLDGVLGFVGCCALACAREACGCHFCAFCLADCGRDAHAHVRSCRFGNGTCFTSRAAFEEAQRSRRVRAIRQYLDDEVVGAADAPQSAAAQHLLRAEVVRDLERELRDLRIDPADVMSRL